MGVRAAMEHEQRGRAQCCEAFGGNVGERQWKPAGHTMLDTPPGPSDRGFVIARTTGKLRIEHRKIAFTSSGAAICGRRDRPIRKTIIGHGMSIFRERFTWWRLFLHMLRVFPLLHQPASQHGGRVFLHPQVEKSADLLAEISGMTETREFIALQRVSRSREKELPRGLGLVVVHVRLRTLCVN